MIQDASDDLLRGFERISVETPAGKWFVRVGGRADAPPVLLLHGFPQTHAMWHRIAPELVRSHRVICADLLGYGQSDIPQGGTGIAAYAKRAVGQDALCLMERLGHARFALVGHDRGARLGYRLALDRPAAIERLALLDIVPNDIQWERIAAAPEQYRHWPFLAQPAPRPEDEIGRDPDGYFGELLRTWSKRDDLSVFDARAMTAYRRNWNAPERIHAMCQDYRAGGADGPDRSADRDDRARGRTLEMPVLVLSSRDFLDSGPEPALEAWRRTFAPHAQGVVVPGGHFVAEEQPEAVLQALTAFLAA